MIKRKPTADALDPVISWYVEGTLTPGVIFDVLPLKQRWRREPGSEARWARERGLPYLRRVKLPPLRFPTEEEDTNDR